jgi:hypothetical protein
LTYIPYARILISDYQQEQNPYRQAQMMAFRYASKLYTFDYTGSLIPSQGG